MGLSGEIMSETARLEPMAKPDEILALSELRHFPGIHEEAYSFKSVRRALKKHVANKTAGDQIECYVVSRR
jgi:hypothetical protein